MNDNCTLSGDTWLYHNIDSQTGANCFANCSVIERALGNLRSGHLQITYFLSFFLLQSGETNT